MTEQIQLSLYGRLGSRTKLGLWWAWKESAINGRELRDALLYYVHQAIVDSKQGRLGFEQFRALESPVELALFGTSLLGDEPDNLTDE